MNKNKLVTDIIADEIVNGNSLEMMVCSNPFPFDVFPMPIQEIIKETNQYLSYPIDFISSSLIYAVSIVIGNTHKVHVKKEWVENAVLFLAIVAPAGTNKSHPLSFALRPLLDHDKSTYKDYQLLLNEYKMASSLSKKEREEQSIEIPIKPVWHKYLLSDFTPEALAEVHMFNKRGVGIYVDELAGWFKNFNRYNKGSEMEFWLSVWSGKPINIDRRTSEPIFIPNPFISVGGTIQTAILYELAKDSRTQNGFIDRILFAFPENLRKEYWSETDINFKIAENWNDIITKIIDLPIKYDESYNPIPELLTFSVDAKKKLYEWQKKNTDEYNDSIDEAYNGIYSKIETYAIRLSLILEVMRFACDESNKQVISLQSVDGALKLVEYFKNSAKKVQSIISNYNPLSKYPSDRQSLYNALPLTFKTEQGVQIANKMTVAERTFKRFLNDRDLFKQIKRGQYDKLI